MELSQLFKKLYCIFLWNIDNCPLKSNILLEMYPYENVPEIGQLIPIMLYDDNLVPDLSEYVTKLEDTNNKFGIHVAHLHPLYNIFIG